MKNEGLKQANILAKWLDMNDIDIDDMNIIITLKDESVYKIMNDGSIMYVSDKDNKAYSNANEIISQIESTKSKDSVKTATFDVIMPIQSFNTTDVASLQNVITDMKVNKVKDGFAYLTYNGMSCEEPETVSADIKLRYGIASAIVTKK